MGRPVQNVAANEIIKKKLTNTTPILQILTGSDRQWSVGDYCALLLWRYGLSAIFIKFIVDCDFYPTKWHKVCTTVTFTKPSDTRSVQLWLLPNQVTQGLYNCDFYPTKWHKVCTTVTFTQQSDTSSVRLWLYPTKWHKVYTTVNFNQQSDTRSVQLWLLPNKVTHVLYNCDFYPTKWHKF